ncbi:Melanopsin [Fragariocoptes setiger]|uniref:Melanopsin n=1 Tax=Fragariocoptes setiger TaxID=1670756 RepID=A0ABQ7SA36_9ACAR|nr:Melanopsin [Fragariocoptes setiger]
MQDVVSSIAQQVIVQTTLTTNISLAALSQSLVVDSSNQQQSDTSYAFNISKLADNEPNQYIKLSRAWYIVLAAASGFGLLTSLISNLMIICIFVRTPSLRSASTILVMNLSISDLVYCVQMPLVIYNCITMSPIFNDRLGCQILGFISVLTAIVSVVTIAAMSMERCYVILHPINGRKRFTTRVALSVTLIIWLYALCLSLPPLFGYFNHYVLDPSLTTCTCEYTQTLFWLSILLVNSLVRY